MMGIPELSNVPNNYGQMGSSLDDSDSIEKSLVADGGTVARDLSSAS